MIRLKNLLTEIGDATANSYKWEEISNDHWNTYVQFITDSKTEYNVELEYFTSNLKEFKELPGIAIEFKAKPTGQYEFSNNIVVNKGEVYKVMATIVDIVKYYIKDARVITYTPEKTSEEVFGSKRNNLYKAYITKAFPNADFKQQGDVIFTILPKTTKTKYDASGIDTPGDPTM